MGRRSLNKLTKEDLRSVDELIEAYKVYLIKKLKYSDSEADKAAKDIQNPYQLPYIVQNYEGVYCVEGVAYEIRSCHTDYCRCGLYHLADVKPFKFKMLFLCEDLKDKSVGSYSSARKAFIFS